jgi:hypothetical protein
MFYFDVDLAENAAEHTDGLVIAGEQQALEPRIHGGTLHLV